MLRSRWLRYGLFLVVIAVAAVLMSSRNSDREDPLPNAAIDTSRHATVALFGASGTAGDGVLKALLADTGVTKIHVVTRRTTPRIDAGVASGRVEVHMHRDFLDYAPIAAALATIDAAYWALGTSARNVSDTEYGVIHVDFPLAFARAWLAARGDAAISFHLVSGGGAGADSRMHWAREKARAERELTELARGTGLRVILYRPAFIVPTAERAHFGHKLMQRLFGSMGMAIESSAIGAAMLETSARADNIAHGTILENRQIQRLADAYELRAGSTPHLAGKMTKPP